jgi:predicted RND superfamily exporter protein
VENSFINYFRPTTEIYKGMQVIDEQLGGTTPLDVIVKFKDKEVEILNDSDDEFDDFDDEFEKETDKNQYWFTPKKMNLILEVHNYLENKPEIGNVQSLATLQKLGKSLNDGKDLDNFGLALIYNKLPAEFKQIILNPYLNIEKNEVRFATRIVDSNPELRRNELIKEINRDLKKIINPENASFRQSNLMILYNNMLQSLFESQIVTLGFVLVLLFMMFLLIFRSFQVALIAIVSNAISISVIFGFMGWFNIPLDLMTITIAAISLGIGVDDTIHYIHRFYEELEKDGDFVKAMHRSHNSVGYAMYYTTFAIMLGFSILVLSNFVPTIYFGFLTMVAMIMALLGAILLLPKLLLLFKPIIK